MTKNDLYPHQKKMLKEALETLLEYLLVYIVGEPRTGKTLTAIFLLKDLYINVLVLTKKKAISSWQKDLELAGAKNFTVTNYEQAHKLNAEYDCIVLDEAHSNLSAYPKMGARAKAVKELCKGLPVVYLSATPSAESFAQLFHQFSMSDFSPWSEYPSFYKWHKEYGYPYTIRVQGRELTRYDKTDEVRIGAETKPYMVTMSKQEAGFDVIVDEKLHDVACNPELLEFIRGFAKDRVATVGDLEIVADTAPSLMSKLHQLSGGTVKQDNRAINVSLHKVAYISENFADESTVILCNYVQERELLKRYLENVTEDVEAFKRGEFQYFIGHIKSFSEGIDFSFADTMVIYSLNFSATTFIQSRERLANKKRLKPITVHYLFTKGGIDRDVYNAVNSKMNFTASYYKAAYAK